MVMYTLMVTTVTVTATAGDEAEVFGIEDVEAAAAWRAYQSPRNSARRSGRSLIGREARSRRMAIIIRCITTLPKTLPAED